MHFAKPIIRKSGPAKRARTPQQELEFSIALLAQEIVVTERRLALLQSQHRYQQMNLDELRTVRTRPMAIIRPARPEPRTTVKVVKRAPYKTEMERMLEAKAAEIFGDLS